MNGIDRFLAQKVIEYGKDKGIIEEYWKNNGRNYIIKLSYAWGDVETRPEYFE